METLWIDKFRDIVSKDDEEQRMRYCTLGNSALDLKIGWNQIAVFALYFWNVR